MASWLSAGSVDDGTVVRRVSAAQTNLKFNAPDLFSPSKLESIFNKDDIPPPDETNESLSFVPSPTKPGRVKSMEEILQEIALSRDTSSVKEAEQLSFIPSPVKQAGIKDLNDLTISNDPNAMKAWEARSVRVKSGPIKPLEDLTLPLESSPARAPIVNVLDESTLPSDLSQGTSIAVKPKNRQSLGTGDYLSEASRVMTYLRQQNQPAAVPSYEEQEPGDQSISDPGSAEDWETEDGEASVSDRARVALEDHLPADRRASSPVTVQDRSVSVIRSPEKHGDWVSDMSPLPEMHHTSDLTPMAARDTTVIRSPEKHVDWIAEMSPVSEVQPVGHLTPMAVKNTTVVRSASKHVDWVEQALGHPDQAFYTTPKYSSILSLTPLPDFTAHEDDPRHPERSFVDDRAHNRALRQAHGTLALSRDALIQAITDAKPDELYWEEITELNLKAKGLASLHGLDELCPNLVILDVSENSLTHLNDIPPGIRTLNISRNLLSDMVCWSGLKNLHCLDICANKNITNLDGFGELVHLRTLRAAACSINNIDGIKILDGLLDLQLQLNKLKSVDFGKTNFAQLESLDISCNKLESVKNLSKLISLQNLHLSQNKISELVPVGRRGPRCLETLDADNNLLEFFNLKQYPNLRYAMLDHNRLKRVYGLGKTPYFEELSIRSQDATSDLVNRILTTPNDCNTLMLSGNPVPDGKLELPELPQHSLRALEITDCGIRELGQGFGRQFPNIRLLNLNFNHIQEISDLQGMHKIKRLELIRNRIYRMRRTCLLLARLPTLAVLDIRDNPLTMAFHPAKGEGGDEEADAKWLRSCDENTKMRRRLTEMLLAEHCKQLRQVNGLGFDRAKILKKEEVWRKCEERGALQGQ